MKKRITKVTTKTGDDGLTGMADGTRVSKSDPVIDAIGDIDELNSLIGYLSSMIHADNYKNTLVSLQNSLFDIGGSLSLGTMDSVSNEEILLVDKVIEDLNSQLPELENFVLPGGEPAAAFTQYVRSVCRRCERTLVKLNNHSKVEENKLIYLNRLSDLFFVIARSINKDQNVEELLWNQDQSKFDK